MEKNIPFCCKCRDKLTQLDLFQNCEHLDGCKKLTRTQWEDGWKEDEDGVLFQHNCPLIKEKEKKRFSR